MHPVIKVSKATKYFQLLGTDQVVIIFTLFLLN